MTDSLKWEEPNTRSGSSSGRYGNASSVTGVWSMITTPNALDIGSGRLWRKLMSICEHKRAPVEHIILFFQGGPTGMPEAWPRDTASPSQFSGNYSFIRNLRRSLPKGTSTLHPLEGAMGMLCQAAMLRKECPKAGFLSHRLEEHHPCPAELARNPSSGQLKARHID